VPRCPRPRRDRPLLINATISRAATLLALTLTAALFLLGGKVISASLFGAWHDAVHVATFIVLALAYALALPRVHWSYIALGVIAIGGAHELFQVASGHQRFGFEYDDFFCNAAGAGLGGCLRGLVKY
jgi:hypothetical protein